MAKPATLGGYADEHTADCERVLVTLLRGLGPWKDSVYLIGGLTPRYLVADGVGDVPAHAGTLDVDVVIDLQMLVDTGAYYTLEDNLRRMRFERAENRIGQKLRPGSAGAGGILGRLRWRGGRGRRGGRRRGS